MIQKTNIDTLHKEGKSQRVITERCVCLQSAVSKHIKCKVDWKEEFGKEKVHKQQGWLQAWEYSQAKLIQTLVRASQGVDWSWSQCIKSHHAQTSSGKSQWSKVLFSDESKFCISFGNQGPRVWRKSGEAQNPCCLKSSVKFPQSVMIWAAMSSAGVGPLCFLKSTVNAAIYQEILEHFMLPSADKLYGDADFIFQQDLAPAHTAKGTKSWFNDHGVTVLDWTANSPDLNPIENLWGIVKRKMRDTRPNNADDLKAAIKATWASIPPQQCHKLITSMPRQIEAVIKAKGAPTKYWVHIQ